LDPEKAPGKSMVKRNGQGVKDLTNTGKKTSDPAQELEQKFVRRWYVSGTTSGDGKSKKPKYSCQRKRIQGRGWVGGGSLQVKRPDGGSDSERDSNLRAQKAWKRQTSKKKRENVCNEKKKEKVGDVRWHFGIVKAPGYKR